MTRSAALRLSVGLLLACLAGPAAMIKAVDPGSVAEVLGLFAYDPGFLGGAWVAGLR